MALPETLCKVAHVFTASSPPSMLSSPLRRDMNKGDTFSAPTVGVQLRMHLKQPYKNNCLVSPHANCTGLCFCQTTIGYVVSCDLTAKRERTTFRQRQPTQRLLLRQLSREHQERVVWLTLLRTMLAISKFVISVLPWDLSSAVRVICISFPEIHINTMLCHYRA